MSTNLTDEQRKRIEANRKLALERRAVRLAEATKRKIPVPCGNPKPLPPNSFYNNPLTSSTNSTNVVSSKLSSINIGIPSEKSPNLTSSVSNGTFNKSNQYKSEKFHPLQITSTSHPVNHGSNPLKINSASNLPGSKSSEPPQRSWNVTTDALSGTLSLIRKDRFILEIGFNSKLVDLCKSIPGRIYGRYI